MNCGQRISVDLSGFFNDHRKYCMLYLDENVLRSVLDLKLYLQQSFNLQGDNLVLMLDDCFLLDRNSLKVLRDGDHLCLIDPGKFSRSTKDNLTESTVKPSAVPKKAPTPSASTSIANGNHEKRQENSHPQQLLVTSNGVSNKRHTTVSESSDTSSDSTTDSSEEDTNPVPVGSRGKKTKLASDPSQQIHRNSRNAASLISNNSAQKVKESTDNAADTQFPLPKRKRVRKRRCKKSVSVPIVAVPPPPVPVPVPIVPRVQQHPARVHIRFDARVTETEEQSARAYPQEEKLTRPLPESDRSDLSHLLAMSRPVLVTRSQGNAACNYPAALHAPAVQKSDQSLKDYLQNLTDMQIWDNPKLQLAPKKGQIVAFKVLCLGADYTPQISQWIIASVCREESEDWSTTTLKILRGVNPFIRDTEGKFELEDADLEKQDENIINIAWQEMVTPKVIPS